MRLRIEFEVLHAGFEFEEEIRILRIVFRTRNVRASERLDCFERFPVRERDEVGDITFGARENEGGAVAVRRSCNPGGPARAGRRGTRRAFAVSVLPCQMRAITKISPPVRLPESGRSKANNRRKTRCTRASVPESDRASCPRRAEAGATPVGRKSHRRFHCRRFHDRTVDHADGHAVARLTGIRAIASESRSSDRPMANPRGKIRRSARFRLRSRVRTTAAETKHEKQ